MKLKVPLWIILFCLYTVWVLIVHDIPRNSYWFPFVFAPLVEELVFRWAIIEATYRIPGAYKIRWQLIVLSSFIFGFIHYVPTQFIVQGLLGFILSYYYIKQREKYEWVTAYISVVLFHALWNVFVYFGIKYLI